jgi:phosphatidylglycerophosphatase A
MGDAPAAAGGAPAATREAPAANGEAPAASGKIPSASVRKTPAVWIATAGGVGFGPWAPGTWGALVAVGLFVAFLSHVGLAAYLVVVAVVSGIGVLASTAAERDLGKHDDGRIVIDEVAGQWVTLLPLIPLRNVNLGTVDLSLGFAPESSFFSFDVWTLLVVTGFVAFRWFDIRKPGLVRWAERRFEAGAGVMADDLVAGVFGAIALTVVAYGALVLRGAL